MELIGINEYCWPSRAQFDNGKIIFNEFKIALNVYIRTWIEVDPEFLVVNFRAVENPRWD